MQPGLAAGPGGPIDNIFSKLDLPPTGTGHRRVLAVLKYLGEPRGATGT